MKKILIISLACILALNFSGCVKTALEKGPTVITDSSEGSIDITEPQEEQAEVKDDSNQDSITDTDSNVPESSDDTSIEDASSEDKDKSDSVDKESSEIFKGIIMLEGMEEEVNYRTYQSESGYQISYDVDRFTVTSERGLDTFMAENINPEIYPYVFFTIYKSEFDDVKPDFTGGLQILDKNTNELKSVYTEKENVKIGNYDAIHIEHIDGNQWNSLVRHIYVISLDKNYYVISTNYFLEASEGYGARIKAMLDTFVIEE